MRERARGTGNGMEWNGVSFLDSKFRPRERGRRWTTLEKESDRLHARAWILVEGVGKGEREREEHGAPFSIFQGLCWKNMGNGEREED